MLPYLARHYQVFLVDLPGYGKSSFTSPWRLREMAPVLIKWLKTLKLSPVVLIGQSMGGAIALHMSALAPASVRQLVLISSAGLPLKMSFPQLAFQSTRSFFQRKNGQYPAELRKDILQSNPLLFWQATQEMMGSDFRTEIAAITMPVLIIWGAQDLLLPLSFGKTLSAALPQATFITLPDCGHRPMLSHPALLSEMVLRFLT